MKIKAKNPNTKNSNLIVPYDGMITIDGNGVAEVSEKAGDVLINSTNDWLLFLEGAVVPENGKKTLTEDEEVIEGIKSMTYDEMISLAEAAGYPKDEYSKFKGNAKNKLMSSYLIKKYNDSKVEESEENEETPGV